MCPGSFLPPPASAPPLPHRQLHPRLSCAGVLLLLGDPVQSFRAQAVLRNGTRATERRSRGMFSVPLLRTHAMDLSKFAWTRQMRDSLSRAESFTACTDWAPGACTRPNPGRGLAALRPQLRAQHAVPYGGRFAALYPFYHAIPCHTMPWPNGNHL